MADVGFLLSLELTKQGRIHGPVVRKIGSAVSQGWIECHGFDFAVEAPRDPQSGLPTGRRRYSDASMVRDSAAGLESFRLPFGFVAYSGTLAMAARDAQTGLATGKRGHKPMVIYKVIDATSPQLQRAAAAGESLKTATLAFMNASGGETLVKLLDCNLVKIGPAPHHLGYRSEALTFVYEKLWINGMPSEDSSLLQVASVV